MVRSIQRINEIDSQVKALDRMLRRSDLDAAGVSFKIRIGMDGDTVENVALTHDNPTILTMIRDSLLKTRELTVIMARGDLRDLTAFFEKEDGVTGTT